MAKMTAKYRTATQTVMFKGLLDAEDAVKRGNQEEVYQVLQKEGFFWNSNLQQWEEHDIADADPPTRLVMVRVWADADIVEEAADDITKKAKGIFEIVERSPVYPCRPPKQREARIYLKFLPK